MAHPRQRHPGQVDRDPDHRRNAPRGRLRDDRQVDRHVRGRHQPRRCRRADRPPRTAHDPRADRGHPQVRDTRRRCARDRVHGAQARVPGGERADDRPLEHRRAHQRPRGPPGRDGRDAARDRPVVAVDLPAQRSADHRRARSGHPRRDARGVRRARQRAARGRSRLGHRRRHRPLRLHRLQGERVDRDRHRRTAGDPPRRGDEGDRRGPARPRRAADEGARHRWQARHVGEPVRRQRSRVDGGGDGEARAVHHRRRPRPSASSTTVPTANGGRSSSPTSPCATCRSRASSRSAPTRGWSPTGSAPTATRPTTSSTSATSTTRRRTRSSTG